MVHFIIDFITRLVGDLIYIDVVTLEGTKLCITGRTKSFYVNSSTGIVFDPRASKMNSEATTLIGLLQKLSPKFKISTNQICILQIIPLHILHCRAVNTKLKFFYILVSRIS